MCLLIQLALGGTLAALSMADTQGGRDVDVAVSVKQGRGFSAHAPAPSRFGGENYGNWVQVASGRGAALRVTAWSKNGSSITMQMLHESNGRSKIIAVAGGATSRINYTLRTVSGGRYYVRFKGRPKSCAVSGRAWVVGARQPVLDASLLGLSDRARAAALVPSELELLVFGARVCCRYKAGYVNWRYRILDSGFCETIGGSPVPMGRCRR